MIKRRLLKLTAACGIAALVSGCAAIGIGGSVDERWADFRSWTKVTNGETGDPTNFIGNVHRGPTGYRNVYVNDIGAATIEDGSEGREFPPGTIVIKEQFKNKAAWESGKGAGHTVSVKDENGTWIWANKLTGKAGPSAFCAGCHGIAAKHDSVFTGGGYHTASN